MKKIILIIVCFIILLSNNIFAEDYESLSKFIGKEVALNHYIYLPEVDNTSKTFIVTTIESVRKEYRSVENAQLSLYVTPFEPFTVEFICYNTKSLLNECINVKQVISIKEVK